MPADQPEPYYIAAVPKESYAQDPSILLGTVGHLVEARGELGDIVIVHVPPGAGKETSRKLGLALGAENNMGGIFPGLPGGPANGRPQG